MSDPAVGSTVWFDKDNDAWTTEPNPVLDKSWGPFRPFKVVPVDAEWSIPEKPVEEPTGKYAVVEADGTFGNKGTRVPLTLTDIEGYPGWIEAGVSDNGRQNHWNWQWRYVVDRNPKIIFEGIKED